MPLFRRVAAAPYPAYGSRRSSLPCPASAAPEGTSAPYPPFRRVAATPTRPGFVRPVTHLPTCATETAGAGGLKIAETFPEGRGSPHGCGLRAVFCRTLPRPTRSLQDKSKVPRSGDFAGRSPGYRGGGDWPPCALPALCRITQKINRERTARN